MEDEEQKEPNIMELKMKMFEAHNPEKAEKLKLKVEEKLKKTQKEIMKMVEKEVNAFFEQRDLERPSLNYIG